MGKNFCCAKIREKKKTKVWMVNTNFYDAKNIFREGYIERLKYFWKHFYCFGKNIWYYIYY